MFFEWGKIPLQDARYIAQVILMPLVVTPERTQHNSSDSGCIVLKLNAHHPPALIAHYALPVDKWSFLVIKVLYCTLHYACSPLLVFSSAT